MYTPSPSPNGSTTTSFTRWTLSSPRSPDVVEVLNVKTALFFLAFLPQFVAPTESRGSRLVVLGTICVALNTLVDVAAVFAADDRLLTAGAALARFVTRASGATMVGLGAFLAFARRDA